MSKEFSKDPCLCHAYPFPHRQASGLCSGSTKFCSSCGDSSEGQIVDFGIGYYEYGSICAVDKQECYVSCCCEAQIIDSQNNPVGSP